jgi:curved DNA-binding protein CbpA
MQEFEEDYYGILGIESGASQEEIRKAYLALAKKLHPDRFPNDPEQRAVAQKEFAKVTRAHDIVSDPDRRLEYDALRQLAKRRSEVVSTGSFVVSAVIPEGERLHEGVGQTPIADDSINFKWANKHLQRADELLRKKRFQEAETAVKEAIRLVPTEAGYHVKLGEIYLARGWKTLAMTEIQTALRLNPQDSDAKNLEVRIKALQKEQAASQKVQSDKKKGIFSQIKDILNKKL